MRRPLNAPINVTQGFGENAADYASMGLVGHHGVDYQAAIGRPVYAPESAVVFKAGDNVTDQYTGRVATGKTIILKGTYEHWLMHLSKFAVQPGQRVNEGDLIGYSGDTGYTFGAHLHWGVRPLSPDLGNGYRGFIDPWYVLQAPPAPVALEGFQRRVGASGVNERTAPNTSAAIHKEWPAGEILDFKGYVRGEDVNGSMYWLVGRYNGRYFHSKAFTDDGLHDLPDLTPAGAATLAGNQRIVGAGGVNYRRTPSRSGEIIQTFPEGDILDFKGFVHGENVDGNDIWFIGAHTGGAAHSSGFNDQGTHDLPELPTTPQTPNTPPAADLTGKVIDISSHNKIVDYAAVKAAVRGVIAKSGHTGKSYGGTIWNGDPTFAERKREFGDKLLGSYWYAYASLNPEDEATAFLQSVGDVPATFSYWLDIEEMDGQTADQINKWCQRFLAKVESVTKRKCGVYTFRNFYNTIITKETLGDRPVWLAHFDTPEMSNPVANQVAHQYTSKGSVPGIEGYVDLNAVTGSFFITPPAPAPTTPGDPQPIPPSTPPPQKDYQAAVVRTITPYIVSFIISILATRGITGSPEFIANITAIITFFVGSIYYAVALWLETKVPQLGWLLGSPKKPVYIEPSKQ